MGHPPIIWLHRVQCVSNLHLRMKGSKGRVLGVVSPLLTQLVSFSPDLLEPNRLGLWVDPNDEALIVEIDRPDPSSHGKQVTLPQSNIRTKACGK